MSNTKSLAKKGLRMSAPVPVRRKSAEDDLLDSFAEVIDNAAEKMSDKEFKAAEKRSSEILDRAIVEHSRRRGTV